MARRLITYEAMPWIEWVIVGLVIAAIAALLARVVVAILSLRAPTPGHRRVS